ncbi:hypothetical protein HYH03_013600 [Edaphochlamys debaryana]|uniref:Uncharacterized protein n=1 Tax=Edaphochlamys debaryana TaxID=47281 RepID=A0A835XQG8_9CHLO|nr:hypothetical protein HYH03_013600 [Edaphochlamys debaryana]|eukprot:KAG2487755.1 hypothetical protein HYH03_013600 [Edaphochlamys debaryana]
MENRDEYKNNEKNEKKVRVSLLRDDLLPALGDLPALGLPEVQIVAFETLPLPLQRKGKDEGSKELIENLLAHYGGLRSAGILDSGIVELMSAVRGIVKPQSSVDAMRVACVDQFLHAVYEFCPGGEGPDLDWRDMLADFLSMPYSTLTTRTTVDAETFRAALLYMDVIGQNGRMPFRRRRSAPLRLLKYHDLRVNPPVEVDTRRHNLLSLVRLAESRSVPQKTPSQVVDVDVTKVTRDAVIEALQSVSLAQFQAQTQSQSLETALLKQRLEYEQRLSDMRCQMATLAKTTSVVDELRAALQEPHRVEVDLLKVTIQKLEAELATLKRSNAGKGALGEFVLAAWLKRTFPAFDVTDISHEAAACDIHVRPRQNAIVGNEKKFFAVESKYKEQVTARDVDKFYRDVATLTETRGEAFLGAIMVSLRTKNIPGRGPFAFEMTPGLKPVVFIGFDDPEDLTLLQYCVSLLLEVAEQCRSSVTSGTEELRRVQGRLKPLVARVSALRKDVDGIKDAAGRIVKTCDGVYGSLALVFDEIARVAGASPRSLPQAKAPNSDDKALPATCPSCGNAFSPKGIKQHLAACQRRQQPYTATKSARFWALQCAKDACRQNNADKLHAYLVAMHMAYVKNVEEYSSTEHAPWYYDDVCSRVYDQELAAALESIFWVDMQQGTRLLLISVSDPRKLKRLAHEYWDRASLEGLFEHMAGCDMLANALRLNDWSMHMEMRLFHAEIDVKYGMKYWTGEHEPFGRQLSSIIVQDIKEHQSVQFSKLLKRYLDYASRAAVMKFLEDISSIESSIKKLPDGVVEMLHSHRKLQTALFALWVKTHQDPFVFKSHRNRITRLVDSLGLTDVVVSLQASWREYMYRPGGGYMTRVLVPHFEALAASQRA